jgi:hypothetical protein
MSDKLAGMAAILILYALFIAIFIRPEIFNKAVRIMHREHRTWWVAPKDPKAYLARPLFIRIYMTPFIIALTWLLWLTLTGNI